MKFLHVVSLLQNFCEFFLNSAINSQHAKICRRCPPNISLLPNTTFPRPRVPRFLLSLHLLSLSLSILSSSLSTFPLIFSTSLLLFSFSLSTCHISLYLSSLSLHLSSFSTFSSHSLSLSLSLSLYLSSFSPLFNVFFSLFYFFFERVFWFNQITSYPTF